MSKRSLLIGAWCGPGFIIGMLVGWLIIGFLPPQQPFSSASEIAAFFQEDPVQIRFGLLIFMWASALYLPFAGVLAVQMAKIEGRYPVWACVQLAAGAGNVLTLTFPTLFWATAAFRLDRDPNLIQLVNDMAWIPFVGMTSPFLIVPISIAIVGFMDKSAQPLFPRWACYYNLFVTALLIPGGVITFFQTGPFAWDGLFGFWIPLTDWGIWFVVTCVLLVKHIHRQADLSEDEDHRVGAS